MSIWSGLFFAKEQPHVVSQTKFWTNVAYAAATYKFVTVMNPPPEIWLYYMLVVGTHTMASKFIDMKFGVKNNDASTG